MVCVDDGIHLNLRGLISLARLRRSTAHRSGPGRSPCGSDLLLLPARRVSPPAVHPPPDCGLRSVRLAGRHGRLAGREVPRLGRWRLRKRPRRDDLMTILTPAMGPDVPVPAVARLCAETPPSGREILGVRSGARCPGSGISRLGGDRTCWPGTCAGSFGPSISLPPRFGRSGGTAAARDGDG